MEIVPLSAFSDNYIWAIVRGARCAIVDPGDAAPVEAFLARRGLSLDHILITHHHDDHIGGVDALRQHHKPYVSGPDDPRVGRLDQVVRDGDTLALGADLTLRVIEVPGHTRSHIAWFGGGYLFCGDTLFGGGCGRLFEGSPAAMHASLERLAALPGDTQVCCAHEYTLGNLRFAAVIEPRNEALAARRKHCEALRNEGKPTLPSSLAEECATNPFLRTAVPEVRAAAEAHAGQALEAGIETFGALRAWKDKF